MTAPHPTMSTAEAAQVLGVGPKKVRQLLRSRDLQGYRITTAVAGRTHAYRVFADSVAAFQAANSTSPELHRARKGLPS